jgi:GTP-binding protein
MMNGYGFGPAPRIAAAEPESSKSSIGSRKDRREARKTREQPPAHSLVLVDMPGYGLNSRDEWGVEIQKYLARRTMLRGAVVLVDAVAGLKDGDRMVLSLLRDADVRTTIVLTKADKLAGPAGSDADLRSMCRAVWDELRDIERGSLTWLEDQGGWDSQIWVTSAGDPSTGVAGAGVAGARLAICNMAGLVEVNGRFRIPEVRASPKVVPFQDLKWTSGAESDEARRDFAW